MSWREALSSACLWRDHFLPPTSGGGWLASEAATIESLKESIEGCSPILTQGSSSSSAMVGRRVGSAGGGEGEAGV